MADHAYRLVNVFALDGDRLSGNPLCVFEDAAGLDDGTMQALARQFNLSETTFVTSRSPGGASARIFTPAFEMPFAGHPTLGTAHVVRALAGGGDRVALSLPVGVVPVVAAGDEWTLEARAPRRRELDASTGELGAMLALVPGDVADGACWIDTGSEQLLVPLRSADAVRRAVPVPALLPRSPSGNVLVYAFAEDGDAVVARFFFSGATGIAEDPATGSACANLGGWHVARRAPLPLVRVVRQGDAVGRPSRLRLDVDAAARIFVTGCVIELGRGVVRL